MKGLSIIFLSTIVALLANTVAIKLAPSAILSKIKTDENSDRFSTKLQHKHKTGNIFRVIGGEAVKIGTKGKERKSPLKSAQELLNQVKPATRAYLLACLVCTLVHVVGLPAPALFSLDKSRLFEIWRPFTAMAFFGPPSMSMANNLYFLIRYGQTLETVNGTGAHTWFLLVQTIILTMLGLLLGFPFQAQAMIAAAVYVSSHLSPMEKMPFQFGLIITSWQLPYYMMAIDCLSQQALAAAWPHLLGIFSGHIFHFFSKVWPSLGGKNWFETPKMFLSMLGDRPNSNIGIDFSSASKESKKSSSKRKPKGKARKLGN